MGRPPRRRWTNAERRRLAELRRSGMTWAQVAGVLGRNTGYCCTVGVRMGLRSSKGPSKPRAKAARAWRLFFEVGLGLEETAARLAVSPDQVEDWLRARARTQRMDRR